MTLEEVAQGYLNEHVDRCLVQVAMAHQGSIEYIQVHDMIRHIIILKAREHNITTIFRGQEEMCFQSNVRRLSVQASMSGDLGQAKHFCKSIRTLYLCKEVGGHISESFLSDLLFHGRKFLKVLYLGNSQLERFPDEIFKLFHLKYLNLYSTNVKFVPKSIGKLRSLQSLILVGTPITELPVEIQKLLRLRHLIVGLVYQQTFFQQFAEIRGVKVSFRIGNLKSLQQLYFIEADHVNNNRVVTEIGKLVHLRVLGITKLKIEDGEEFCSSLGNLRQLGKLYVYAINENEFIDLQYCKSSDLPRLRILSLAGRLEKCPQLISSLDGLTIIELKYSRLSDDPLKSLQDLPNLITVNLVAAYVGESLCFKAGGFPKLKDLHLCFLQELRWVTVEENALPSLLLLRIRGCQSMEEIPTGIEYLFRLQNLDISNMSNEFVTRFEYIDKQSAAYKRLIQIPRVVIATWISGTWFLHLNKETATLK